MVHAEPILTPPKVLVVDDEAAIRELVARVLETHGLRVQTAANGEQAIQIAQEDPDICLTILDWRMPDMKGDQVYDRLSTVRHNSKGMKVIVMSGERLEVAKAFSGRPIDHFLRKPFTLQSLVSTVESVLVA